MCNNLLHTVEIGAVNETISSTVFNKARKT